MPATEQTWRDLKLMHVVFAVSGLIMLIGTIWMLAADHSREWKVYQRTFRDVEAESTDYRIAQQNNEQYERDQEKLEAALVAAQQAVPPAELLDRFQQELEADAAERKVDAPDFKPVEDEYQALASAKPEDRLEIRARLIRELSDFAIKAKFRESVLGTAKKNLAADFDVVRSKYGILVDENAPQEELGHVQHEIDEVHAKLDAQVLRVQAATTHRKKLERIIADMTAQEAQVRKDLDAQRSKLTQLVVAKREREDSWQKELLAMPIIDAFGRPLKIEQIWLPKLTIFNNFRDVARFDRCTTCHQGIDKSAPGSAVEPAYQPVSTMSLTMNTPEEAPNPAKLDELDSPEKAGALLREVYGLELAAHGLIARDDVTVMVLHPESLSAKAQLQVGDVIESVNGAKVRGRDSAYAALLQSVNWGKPIALGIRRGLPHPYVSHPRLDLFIGSLSPHPMMTMGCTVCHDGQGSATTFKWASHTPSSPNEASDWKREYGWFNNHYWSFPMMPARFSQSLCLKCHHEVVELEPSQRLPDPPAPQLTAGFHAIRRYGCFGCHEINGYDGPNRRIGPDLRAEPNYSAAAQALLATGALSEQCRDWAEEVVFHPENNTPRRQLVESLRVAASRSSSGASKAAATAKADDNATIDTADQLTTGADIIQIRKLSAVLEDVEAPGRLRKVGPSLRHVASKLDFDFLYSWIRKPSDFRPTTKMPQFFGLDDHLGPGEGLEETQKYEPVEIRSAVEFLLAKSQPFEFSDRPKGVTQQPSAERGKDLFQTRGCLACHQHGDFPGGKMTQGPDLSNIGSKLARKDNANGAKWLYSWLRNPSRYHPRTLMPNLILDPVASEGKTTDPAADITAFLLRSGKWDPADVPSRELDKSEQDDLHDLAIEHLSAGYTRSQAEEILKKGIPEDRRGEIKGDEIELLGPASPQKVLNYVGRRTISKYGCSGCHDVPGFEDVKPIGTGLADWGRKGVDKLAFEQISQYITRGHGRKEIDAASTREGNRTQAEQDTAAVEEVAEFKFQDLAPDLGYFLQALLGHQREGFIWQKLRAPRSFDYQKTQNKGYNERLRMPYFTGLDEAQREQVITFVLGLVSEPPASQYVYHATPRNEAVVKGLDLIEKFNCVGCHTFEMDRWKLAYSPDDFKSPAAVSDYSFLLPHFSPKEIETSLQTDNRGLRHALVTGMPTVNDQTGEPARFDEDGIPVEEGDTETKALYSVALWRDVLINGEAWQSGVQNLLVPEATIEKHYEPLGGFLPRYLLPKVVADEKKVNPNAKAEEAWGWLPPPLVHEGSKVQSNWLHDFLLDPYPIRPAVVLRMPKFNMSSDEATALANYFAAVDDAQYPYDFDPRTREGHLTALESKHPNRMQDAMKVITDNNYCIKCHLVGDFDPTGSNRVKGPHLDDVYKRLRPEFVVNWIANPKRLLPYTGMPVNIPYDKPVNQSLFPGTSVQQLNGLADFLLNYDRYMESRTPIKPMIKAPPTGAAANQPAPPPAPQTTDAAAR